MLGALLTALGGYLCGVIPSSAERTPLTQSVSETLHAMRVRPALHVVDAKALIYHYVCISAQ